MKDYTQDVKVVLSMYVPPDPQKMQAAYQAGKVSGVVSSAMLASDDMLDVIGEEWLRVLRQAAVFAAITGSFTDSLPEPLVHQAA